MVEFESKIPPKIRLPCYVFCYHHTTPTTYLLEEELQLAGDLIWHDLSFCSLCKCLITHRKGQKPKGNSMLVVKSGKQNWDVTKLFIFGCHEYVYYFWNEYAVHWVKRTYLWRYKETFSWMIFLRKKWF